MESLLEIEIRLTAKGLEEKLTLQSYSGDNLRYCCICKSGLTKENKPIYYTAEQVGELKQKPKSHGYCIPCLKNYYLAQFGIPYDKT